MAEAVAAIAAKAAEAVAAFVYNAAVSVGVSTATAVVVSNYAASITIAVVATAAYIGPSLLFRPNIPDPAFAKSVRKQPIPDRVSGYGRDRIGGAYMLYEAIGTRADMVYAMHDGLIDGWETLYLNDRPEVIGGDGYVQQGADLRYGVNSDLVQIDQRLGLPTETRYPLPPTSIWPSNARGDGIASLFMRAKSSSKEQFLRDYPNGLPIPSRVARMQICWDPRLGARGTINNDADKAASATWAWTPNPILHLLDYMTNPSTGMGFEITRFLPRIADWIEAANVCDEVVGGETAGRYEAGGVYLHSTAPADVIATLLACCDGWMTQDGEGAFTVQAGAYYEPTVIIKDEHIVGLSRQFFIEDERAVNEMVVTFKDPAFDYTEVETDPIRNEEDIEARGEVRSQRLSFPWVQSNAQAQRLGKIALAKASAPISGTVTTTLEGLKAFAERRIRIQAPSDSEVMADIVVDIAPLTLNPDMTVSIPFKSCDPTVYDAAISGSGPGDDVRPPLLPIPTPIVVGDTLLDSGGLPRLQVRTIDPDRDDYRYAVYYSVDGGPEVREELTPTFDDGEVVLNTGVLPTGQTVTYQVTVVSSRGEESLRTAAIDATTTGLPGGAYGNASYAESAIAAAVNSMSWQTVADLTFPNRTAGGWWEAGVVSSLTGSASGASNIDLEFRVIEAGEATALATSGSVTVPPGPASIIAAPAFAPPPLWPQQAPPGSVTVQLQARIISGSGTATISGIYYAAYTPAPA